MIKAIGFDLGGVLIQNAAQVFYERAAEHLNVPLEKLVQVFELERKPLERGEVSAEQFWHQLVGSLGLDYRPEMISIWTQDFVAHTPAIPRMLELVDALRANGYRLGLLSNTTAQHVAINRTRGIFDRFDVALMSNEIGTRKPEKEAYLELLRALDTSADETVFVDDLAENVAGAQDIGIHAIKFSGYENLLSELKKLGVKLKLR